MTARRFAALTWK